MRIAIVGKGALGLLFADAIASTQGNDAVVFVMDEAHIARHAGDVYTINGEEHRFANATPEQAGSVDLVIVATKATGLEAALDEVESLLKANTGERSTRDMAAGPSSGADSRSVSHEPPDLDPSTWGLVPIISVLNGVRSEEIIAARFGWERVVPCVAQGMDAARYGSNLHFSKRGELHIGRFEQTPEATYAQVRDLLTRAGIPVVEETDIRYRMWAKFVINVGINQCCAVYGVPYAGVLGDHASEAWRTYIAAMRETVAVGQAEGVLLSEHDINEAVRIESTLDQTSTPSMGQDRINRHPSEVDEFAGEVIRRAAKHGIYVPANEWLYRRMREIEAAY